MEGGGSVIVRCDHFEEFALSDRTEAFLCHGCDFISNTPGHCINQGQQVCPISLTFRMDTVLIRVAVARSAQVTGGAGQDGFLHTEVVVRRDAQDRHHLLCLPKTEQGGRAKSEVAPLERSQLSPTPAIHHYYLTPAQPTSLSVCKGTGGVSCQGTGMLKCEPVGRG